MKGKGYDVVWCEVILTEVIQTKEKWARNGSMNYNNCCNCPLSIDSFLVTGVRWGALKDLRYSGFLFGRSAEPSVVWPEPEILDPDLWGRMSNICRKFNLIRAEFLNKSMGLLQGKRVMFPDSCTISSTIIILIHLFNKHDF